MTATEVAAREAEKVLGFNPSFTLFVSDFRLMCQRIMALLYRAGKLPDPVPGVFETCLLYTSREYPAVVRECAAELRNRNIEINNMDCLLYTSRCV